MSLKIKKKHLEEYLNHYLQGLLAGVSHYSFTFQHYRSFAMPHLVEVIPSSSSLLTNSSSSPFLSNSLQPLLSALGWQDLRPAILAAEQADQALALEFQQAYDAYSRLPESSAAERLQSVVDRLIEKRQADLVKAQALHQAAQERLAKSEEAGSGGYLVWLKQSVQAFFSSDDASLTERYAGIAERCAVDIATLSKLREVLTVQIESQQEPKIQISSLSNTLFPASFNLADLNGTNGFAVIGASNGEQAGWSVSSGDINGDEITDLLIGTAQDASYVVFGSNATVFPTTLSLSSLDGKNGFKVTGVSGDAGPVRSGDINGDGITDLLIGAGSVPAGARQGASYIVFGSRAAFSATITLSSLNGTNGFKVMGINRGCLQFAVTH
jgi:hypothetical protein